MAYAPDYNDEEDEENQSGEQVLSGQSSELGQGAGGGSQQQSQSKPTQSGSWTNLLSYVNANEGNDAQMGEKIKGGLENRAQNAQSMGQTYGNKANQQVSENVIQDSGINEEVKSNAKGVYNDAEKKSQFDKQWDAYYKGPQQANEVEGYEDAQKEYKAVEDRAKTAETYDGRYALLEDEYARPNYTRGEKTLDSFILGAGQQGQQVLGDIKQNYGNYTSGWNDLVNSVSGNIQNAKDTTNQTRENTRNAVNSAIQNQENAFKNYQNQLAQEQSANQQRFNELQSGLSNRNADYYDDVGLDFDIGNYLSGMGDLGTAISRNGARRIGDLANQNEVDNYNALLNLGRVEGGNFQDFSKSGNTADAYKLNTGLIDTARQAKAFQDDINAKVAAEQAKRDAEYTNMIRTLNAGKDKEKIGQLLNMLGISQSTYQNYRDREGKKLDFGKIIGGGRSLVGENVMNTNEKNSWAPLMNMLQQSGFAPGMSDKLWDAGSYYDFDKKALKDFNKKYSKSAPEMGPAMATNPLSNTDELPWWIDPTKSDPVGTGSIAKTKGGSSVSSKVKKKTGI